MAVFVAASAACALSSGPLTLIGARLLQGLSAGLMVPAGQAVIGSTAERDQLGRLFGTLGLVVALGPAVGPAFGGFLLEAASWRWLFWINVPIGIVTLIAARNLVPAGSSSTARTLDRKGLALLGIGLPALLYGAIDIGATGATTTSILALVFGTAMGAGFIFNSAHVSAPLVDLRLLRGRVFAAATFTTGCTGANMFGGLLLLPLYLQLVAGQSSAETGLMLLAMGVGTAAALPVGGTLTDRYGAGSLILAGAILLVVTAVPFLFSTSLSTTWLVLLLVGRGAGLALAQMPATTAAYASVSAEQIGDATTLVNIIQRVGGAIGAACVVIALAQFGGIHSPNAYRWTFGFLLVISLLTLIPAATLQRHADARRAAVR